MSRVYAIVDEDVCQKRGISAALVFGALLEARVSIIQYRAKGQSDDATLSKLRELVQLRAELGPKTEIFANDRPDLAELAGTDGVHLGQTDMPIEQVRAHFPRLKVGVSTHNAKELEAALDERPDYVAIGPVFETQSKKDPEPTLGLFGLAELAAHARAAGVPSVAIGGITEGTLGSVLAHADRAATISALVSHVDEATNSPELQIKANLAALERQAWDSPKP